MPYKKNNPSQYKCPKCKKKRLIRIEDGFKEKYKCENCRYELNPSKVMKLKIE